MYINLVDAITIHEYSLKSEELTGYNQYEQIEIISQWGLARIPAHVTYVNNFFDNANPHVPIWMTEFNLNGDLGNSSISYQVLHAMFTMLYKNNFLFFLWEQTKRSNKT